MSIQTRLKKQRYDERQIILPSSQELRDEYRFKARIRKPATDSADKVLFHMLNPPVRDRHYPSYIYTVNKYHEFLTEVSAKSAKQSLAYIVNRDMALTLMHMLDNPNRYGTFESYKIPWLFNILCSMREFVLKQRYLRGEIQSSRSITMWSHGHEPFPKPLGLRAGGELADILFDIIYPRVEYLRTLI